MSGMETRNLNESNQRKERKMYESVVQLRILLGVVEVSTRLVSSR
jgi:hypothetical protein